MRNSKEILFVSEVQDPNTHGSSTQILTENLLQGFKDNGYSVIFIATYDSRENINNIISYYRKYVNRIIPVKSLMDLTSIAHNKYAQLFRTVKMLLLYRVYKSIELNVNESTILLSHTPSLEAAFICKALLRRFKFKKYIQYWSDPYALSGIYPEKLSVKRWPHIFIEKSIIKIADEVVYSGKPIYLVQKMLYKKYSEKMRYVDYSYSHNLDTIRNKPPIFGYVGNYMSSTRNIRPLFNVFSNIENTSLIVCGTGDVIPPDSKNILVEKRKPQNEIGDIEAKIDVFVCIINHSCLQMPAKIFYKANTDKIILVILDGKYKDLFYNYLSQFNRFEFCDNNEESIRDAVDRICAGKCKVDLSCIDKLSPKYVSESILNANNMCI